MYSRDNSSSAVLLNRRSSSSRGRFLLLWLFRGAFIFNDFGGLIGWLIVGVLPVTIPYIMLSSYSISSKAFLSNYYNMALRYWGTAALSCGIFTLDLTNFLHFWFSSYSLDFFLYCFSYLSNSTSCFSASSFWARYSIAASTLLMWLSLIFYFLMSFVWVLSYSSFGVVILVFLRVGAFCCYFCFLLSRAFLLPFFMASA